MIIKKNNLLLSSFLSSIKKMNSISLIWINKRVNVANTYIWPDELHAKHITEWAKFNPTFEIYLWYCSSFCTSEQLNLSKSRFKEVDNIRILDLEELVDNNSFRYISTNKKSHVKDLYSNKVIPVYWKADVARYIILTYLAKKMPGNYHCYSDLDLSPYNIECSFRAFPFYKNRLQFFGLLFCHSEYASSGLENGFIILNGNAKSTVAAIELTIIDFGCLLMYYFFKLCGIDEQLLSRVASRYSLHEWGFAQLTRTFNFDAIIRDQQYLNIQNGQTISFKGANMGISSDRLSLNTFITLISLFPFLLLEDPLFWVSEEQYSLNSYKPYLSITHKNPRNRIDRDNKCYFAASCSDSTFVKNKEDAIDSLEIQNGTGHFQGLVNNVAGSLKDLSRHGLNIDSKKFKHVEENVFSF